MSAETRNRWFWVGLLAVGVALVAGMMVPRWNTTARGPVAAWIATMALLAFALGAFGKGTNGRWLGALIDDRCRVSLSRMQMAAWTVLTLAAVFAIAGVNTARGASNPLDITIPAELWVLMGISSASFAGSQLIKSTQIQDDKIEPNDSLRDAHLTDIVQGEKRGEENRLDLSKIQVLMLTLVVLVAYASAVGELLTAGGPGHVITALPAINGGIVSLLAISHAGYLTFKSVPSGTQATDPTPAEAGD